MQFIKKKIKRVKNKKLNNAREVRICGV